MARCNDCIHGECCSIFVHTRTVLCNDKAEKMCKLFKSTADVVPKSEYDTVVSAVDNSTKEFLKLHDAYQNAKAEVERLEGELIVERTRRENAVNAYHAAKSEVETEYKYCHAVGYAKVYTKTLEDYYKTRKSIAKEGKAEVAREIFEEIDILGTYNPTLYAELKKKYTENME